MSQKTRSMLSKSLLVWRRAISSVVKTDCRSPLEWGFESVRIANLNDDWYHKIVNRTQVYGLLYITFISKGGGDGAHGHFGLS